MARPVEEECDPNILEYHNSIYPSVEEQDKILEEYFSSNRTVPTPLEIEIFQRHVRNDPNTIRINDDRISRRLREDTYEKITKLLTK